MNDMNRQPGAHAPGVAASGDPDGASSKAPGSAAAPETDEAEAFDDSISGEIAALVDDGRTYFEAEVAFQKTRAKLAGKSIGIALACVIIALILLNIAFLALAVGLVIALAPIVTIWGAIAIVVGALLLIVGWLGWIAIGRGKLLSEIFGSADEDSGA